jgi:phospholipid-binding lipoprotein MlaA
VFRNLSFLASLLAFLAGACAHSPSRVSSPSSDPSARPQLAMLVYDPGLGPLKSSTVWLGGKRGDEMAIQPTEGRPDPKENPAEEQEVPEEKPVTIADPLEPFNRAMFQFNDKLYFWALKPVAQGYNKVVPEGARVSVKNFFYNLKFPIRFISCLLQADLRCMGTELGRFTVNTVWGVGGLLDPASSEQVNIPKREADLGQTLGVYGLGQGFYIVWPVLGPSSGRDSVGIVGDFFLYPVSYISPWYAWLGVRGYEEVNETSLRIGDYESLKEAAIDPYVALRDAYVQYRQSMVRGARGKPAPPKPGGVR